ncbi:MAG TPA: PPC domain-containing protein [Pyrinomonadaceae bacterium]|nr:PPC domain-containing protein [Pyrinomonadaceae bacterium]
MGKLRTLLLSPLLICSALTVSAQTTLQLGTPIERTLGPGQVHEFTVNLEENNFIQLVVDQRGIDVYVKVSSPAGKNLGEYDTPNGSEGPEHVSFLAAAAGTYRIAISPLGTSDQTTGRYEIKLLEVRQATDQELKANKNLEEVKAKGIALLAEIETTISEIKSPSSRIQAQLKAAELLWEVDEKRAGKLMSNAIAGMKEFLATADTGSEDYMQQYQLILQLRGEMGRVLAERDPEAALNFLQSTTPRYGPYSNTRELFMQESGLELSIANQIAEKDPNRAAQIARRSLKQGYSYNLVSTVSQLAQKNPELAKDLVHEIAGKLLSEEKLIKNPDGANLAMSLLQSYHTPQEGDQVITTQIASPVRSGLLSEDEYKQLLQKALDEVLSYTPRMMNPGQDAIWNMIPGLQSLGAEMDRAISGSKAALDKKIAEINGAGNMIVNPVQEYQNAIGSNQVETALETIEKAPADYRDQLYIQLANREATNGDLARARQIVNDHITNPYQRRQVLANIDQQEMYRAVGKGKIEEALRNVSNVRNPKERAAWLSQIVNQIGQGQNRATALSLLEQARALLNPSPQAQDSEQMNALFEIARAFSNYDAKRSFEIVDPLIDQFNDICAAARTLEGFGGEYFDDDELNMQNGNGVANVVSLMSMVLGDLALTNFDRAKATTEKIRLPEVRLKVYLEIAQHTIEGGHR